MQRARFGNGASGSVFHQSDYAQIPDALAVAEMGTYLPKNLDSISLWAAYDALGSHV